MKKVKVYLKIHKLEEEFLSELRKKYCGNDVNKQFFNKLYLILDELINMYLNLECSSTPSDHGEIAIKAHLIRQDIIKQIIDDDFDYSNRQLISLIICIIGGINVYRKFVDIINDNNYSFNLHFIRDKRIVEKYFHLTKIRVLDSCNQT